MSFCFFLHDMDPKHTDIQTYRSCWDYTGLLSISDLTKTMWDHFPYSHCRSGWWILCRISSYNSTADPVDGFNSDKSWFSFDSNETIPIPIPRLNSFVDSLNSEEWFRSEYQLHNSMWSIRTDVEYMILVDPWNTMNSKLSSNDSMMKAKDLRFKDLKTLHV